MKISSKPASGTRDFLAPDVRKRRYVIERIREAYEQFGFEPLETPAFERLDVLTGKYGEEGDQLMFKLLVRGDKLAKADVSQPDTLTDLALHYDLTVPFARAYAQHRNKLPKYYKRYQIQPVWRADRPQHGRFREFYQCDVDYVGSTSFIAEAEVIGAMQSALAALDFDGVTIRINDRRLLDAIMTAAEVRTEERPDVLATLDRLDKIGAAAVIVALKEDNGLGAEQIDRISGLIPGLSVAEGTGDDPLQTLTSGLADAGVDTSAADSMRQLIEILGTDESGGTQVLFDPTLVRGMSYYTGPIFEFVTDDFSGSIAGGGRYDGLVGMFSGQDVPAVGGSLGLERILVLMEERDMLPTGTNPMDVLIARMDDATLPRCMALSAQLRSLGLSASVHPDAQKLGKQFRYAESVEARFVAILGSRELEQGVVQMKHLESGDQTSVALDDVAAWAKTSCR